MKRKSINIKKEIKKYFFTNPTAKLRVRQIERTLNLSLPSVIRYCKELTNEGILTIVKTGNVVFYAANRGNEGFVLEKSLFNLKQLHRSGLVKYLKESLHNPVIIVFGSYVKGEDTEESDIDLYVETLSKRKLNLKDFENKLSRGIQIFRHKSIKGISNPHLANNIINGVVLNGFIEVFK